MLQKILVSILVAAVGGGILTSCDQPEKKEPSAPSSPGEEVKPPDGQTTSGTEGGERKTSAQTSEQKRRFAQRLSVKTPIQTLQVGQVVTIPVVVRNLGPEPWLAENAASGERAVKLWYHWIDWTQETRKPQEQASSVTERRRADRLRLPQRTSRLRREGKVVEFGGIRTSLPHVVNPRESANIEATVKAPARPGAFILRLTMMRPGDGSFENKGGAPLDLPVTVTQ